MEKVKRVDRRRKTVDVFAERLRAENPIVPIEERSPMATALRKLDQKTVTARK